MVRTESTASGGDRAARRRRGAWYTPPELVTTVIEANITADWVRRHHRAIRVLDPACGDGRFLRAAADRISELGGDVELLGIDVDPEAIGSIDLPGADLRCADALEHTFADGHVDLVVGNPPFLSPLTSAASRRGSSRHGGGPYADAAVEFLAMAARIVRPGGRIALVLPQSILASRDAATVRHELDRTADLRWWWWSPERWFDADVVVCALGFERHARPTTDVPMRGWGHVVAGPTGVPALPELDARGVVADRADLNANFRDEYYGMVPAVVDGPRHAADRRKAPPLVTSGLIDPARCRWGERPIRFAKRRFEAPRVELDRLDERMRAWAERKLVPKVLVASQTAIVEAVADHDGAWLPGVPVTTLTPHTAPAATASLDQLVAVLTSPAISAWCWHAAAGTGLSASTIRIGPTLLGEAPWPAGDLDPAVEALRRGDLAGCGAAVDAAYGIRGDHADVLLSWWLGRHGGRRRATRDDPAPSAPSPAIRRSTTAGPDPRAR